MSEPVTDPAGELLWLMFTHLLQAGSLEVALLHDAHVTAAPSWTATIHQIANDGGCLEVQQCTECPFRLVYCAHTVCNWSADGTRLTCDVCGVDAT